MLRIEFANGFTCMRLVNFCMFGVLDQPIFLNSGIFLADGKLKHRICSQIVSLSLKVVSLKRFSVENGFHAGMDAQPRREVFLHSFFLTSDNRVYYAS